MASSTRAELYLKKSCQHAEVLVLPRRRGYFFFSKNGAAKVFTPSLSVGDPNKNPSCKIPVTFGVALYPFRHSGWLVRG